MIIAMYINFCRLLFCIRFIHLLNKITFSLIIWLNNKKPKKHQTTEHYRPKKFIVAKGKVTDSFLPLKMFLLKLYRL